MLKELGLSNLSIIIIGILVSVVGIFLGWIGFWLKKNYDGFLISSKKYKSLQNDFEKYKIEVDRNIFNSKEKRNEEQKELRDEIEERVKETINRIWTRIDENKSSLNNIIDRLASCMNTYDTKLYDLDKKLHDDLISRSEYHRELASLKDTFFKELVEVQRSIFDANSSSQVNPDNKQIASHGQNIEVQKILKSVTENSKKMIDSERRVLDIENQISLHGKKLKEHQRLITSNESSNIDKNIIVKKAIIKSVKETIDINDRNKKELLEHIMSSNKSTVNSIKEIIEKSKQKNQVLQANNDSSKISGGKLNFDYNNNVGKVIKK